MYLRLSREELGGRFLGPLAYLDPKGDGDQSTYLTPAMATTIPIAAAP
jgi:hypothetical protein